MKKIFNYALLAAALLVGVNVNAVNEVSLSINGGAATEYAKFTDALKAICEDARYNTEAEKTEATITLLVDVTGVQYETWMTSFVQDGDKTDRIKLNRGEYITIDLNGKTLTSNLRFNAYHGGVLLTGKKGSKVLTNISQFITLYGCQTDMKAVSGYSYALIDENVSLVANANNVYYCAGMYVADQKQTPYSGIKVDIKGQLISTANQEGCAFASSGNMQFSREEITIPVINIYPTAVLQGSDALYTFTEKELTGNNNKILNEIIAKGYTDDEARQYKNTGAGLYCPGVAEFNIEGTVKGGVGIYIKGGKVNITNAHIFATAAEYWKPIVYGNGFYGAGSAIILDSHEDYGTLEGVTIQGSTISSDNGYAIEEDATKGESSLPVIEVISGTFVGGITTTPEEREELVNRNNITGGEWHGQDVSQYINSTKNTIIYFVDGDGVTYEVVVPITDSDWSTSIADAATKAEGLKYAKVAANEDVNTDTKVEFVRIQKNVVVTVKSGATLDAGTLMTEGPSTASPGGETGKIIVEAGGTLIVSGKQGAYTYNENSLVIEASETNSGIVLINPAVVLNTTPKATIEFISKAWRTDANHKVYQRFGLPTGYELSSIVCNTEGGYKTQLDYMDIVEGWVNAGVMESSASEGILEKFNKPFIYCSMLSNNPSTTQMSYTFTGRLAGNTNATLEIRDQFMGHGNSYMGKLNINAMVSALDNLNGSVDATVYAYEDKGAGRMGWNGYGIVDLDLAEEEKNLNPMQPFMLYNKVSSSTPVILNYKDFVWKPVMGEEESSSAPRRASRQNMTAANIVLVNAEGLFDKATFAKSESFSSEYESGYDVVKYFDNEDNMSIYFSADQTLATIATNEAHAFVGVSVEKAGEYTIKFNKVRGENLELVDLNNNQHIAIAEGNEYSFYAEGSNDYRFEIIAGAQAPTAMDKVDAKANAVKVISNGEFRIVKDGRTYNAIGAEL